MITFVFSFFNPNFNKICWYCYRNACVWSQICCYHTSDYFDLKDNYSCSKRILIQIESRFKETCMSISMLRNISLYFHFLTRILSVRFHCFGFLKVFQSLSQVEYVSNCAFCERKIQLALINSFSEWKVFGLYHLRLYLSFFSF